MRRVNDPTAAPFVIPDDHPNRKAHEWLDTRLRCFELVFQAASPFRLR
jgi:hypothetical protein